MAEMVEEPITSSSHDARAGYDREFGTLHVWFKNGAHYAYEKVKPQCVAPTRGQEPRDAWDVPECRYRSATPVGEAVMSALPSILAATNDLRSELLYGPFGVCAG